MMMDAETMMKLAKGAIVYGNNFHDQSGVFAIHNHVPGEIVNEKDKSKVGNNDEQSAKPEKVEKTLIDKVRETTVGEIIDTVTGKRR